MLNEFFHLLFELALAPADDGSHHHDSIFRRERHYALHDLFGGLASDCSPAIRAVGNANRGE